MLLPTFINVNLNGIPAIRSLSVNVTSTEVLIDFNNHRNVGNPFRGLIIVNIALIIPTGTTTTLPIVFTSEGGNPLNLVGYSGELITVADITGTGIYLVWFENTSNTLLLVSKV